jgi:hypothetical protein
MWPNAFFTVPDTARNEKALAQKRLPFFRSNDRLILLGRAAVRLARAVGKEARKPIERGIISPEEKWSVLICNHMISALAGRPRHPGERACFSIPGPPVDGSASVVFHEAVIKRCLERKGYHPESINEGLAVVLAELGANRCTGIGISLGGGMCNVCFAYLAVPVIAYSLPLGGDAIDRMVGQAVGKPAAAIRGIKESNLDLSAIPKTRTDTALRVYYDHLFASLVESLRQVL